MYKVLTNKEFTDETDSPFKKVEPHKKFNTQCGTVYSRQLAESTKKEITAMCIKDMVEICMPRSDNGDRLMGPQIIELKF